MALKNAASDIAAKLTGNTVGGQALVSGQNLFSTPAFPQSWSISVVCLNSDGGAPEPYIGAAAQKAILRPTVQVLVYAPPGEAGFTDGETLARAIVAALQQATGYGTPAAISTLIRGSAPIYVGIDEATNQHVWSSNFEVVYEGTVDTFS